MTDIRVSYSRDDVLSPDQVREALGPFSDSKWKDVSARLPWSDALGARTLRIRWGALLDWLEGSVRLVA
jgi:hypothetical protein